MANKTTLLWGIILVSVSSACDQLRMPKVPESAARAESASPPKPAARPARATGTASAAEESAAFDGLRTGLRRLVVAEETFFAENGTYTNDLERLQYKPGPGNSLRFLWMSATGWAASGTHAGVTGKDCVIYVGRDRGAPTTLKYVRKGKEGVPVCDSSPLPAPRVATKRPTEAQPATPTPSATTTPPAAAAAPTATARNSTEPDTSSALDAVNPVVAMKVDLRNLVRSQQTYFAQQGLYARSTEPFALQFLWHRGVTITILSADVESWSARATHSGKHGKSCVIWFGPVPTRPATSAEKRATDEAAEPVCDD
jgi:hypothetical protein